MRYILIRVLKVKFMFEYDENFTVTLLPILKKSIQAYNS